MPVQRGLRDAAHTILELLAAVAFLVEFLVVQLLELLVQPLVEQFAVELAVQFAVQFPVELAVLAVGLEPQPVLVAVLQRTGQPVPVRRDRRRRRADRTEQRRAEQFGQRLIPGQPGPVRSDVQRGGPVRGHGSLQAGRSERSASRRHG